MINRPLDIPHTIWTMPAIVERIIDGDTVVACIEVMPGMQLNEEHIRVQGINAPELGTALGIDARIFAESLLPIGCGVVLTMSSRDKYGRVLAKIKLPDGRDFGDTMMQTGHAVAYMT